MSSPLLSPAHAAVIAYYDAAGLDYAAWSPRFNMHFGYYRRGLGLLDREAMLEQMNAEVLARLQVGRHAAARLVDLGCGLGTVARFIARRRPRAQLAAVTIVPSQVHLGRQLTADEGLAGQVSHLRADFAALPLRDADLDGAYAIESVCHAPAADHERLVAELARVLRPGARVVIADGMRRRAALARPIAWLYGQLCRAWALADMIDLDGLRAALARHGFVDIRVEDISWRVAPSAAHIPAVALGFLWRERRTLGPRSGARWRHVQGSALAGLLGMCRRSFGYFLVTATRGP